MYTLHVKPNTTLHSVMSEVDNPPSQSLPAGVVLTRQGILDGHGRKQLSAVVFWSLTPALYVTLRCAAPTRDSLARMLTPIFVLFARCPQVVHQDGS